MSDGPASNQLAPIALGPYTLQIANLRWNEPVDWWWSHDTERLLRVRYNVTRNSDGQVLDPAALAHDLEVRAYAPHHQVHWTTVLGQEDSAALVPNLDPRQSPYRIDFILRDPAATPQQLGDAHNDVLIEGLAIDPTHFGRQPVSRRYFTTFGQTCRINTIVVRPPERGDLGETTVDIIVEPATDGASIKTAIEDKAALTDAQGDAIGSRQGASIAFGPNHWILTFAGVPSPGTHSLNLKFGLDESSGITDPSVLYHGSLTFSAAAIRPTTPQGSSITLASSSANDLHVRMDRYHVWGDGSAQARVWLSNTNPNSTVEWVLDRITGTWADGVDRELPTQQEQYWLLNGVPAPSGAAGVGVYVNAPKAFAGAPPQRLIIAAHPVERTEQDISFGNIPVALPGQDVTLDRTPDFEDRTGIRLVAVSSARDGLIVSLRAPVVSHSSTDIKITAATDNRGLWLLPKNATVITREQSSTPPGPAGSEILKFLLHLPSENAATFDVLVHVTTTTLSGPQQRVTLTGIDSVASTD